MTLDRETMEAAVVGLTTKRDEIEQKIAEIRKLLGSRTSHAVTPISAGASPRKHYTMSAAARKRIAEGQKKRWAAWHARRKKGE